MKRNRILIYILIIAALVLCISIVHVDSNSRPPLAFHDQIVQNETTNISEVFSIPIMSFTDREADDTIEELHKTTETTTELYSKDELYCLACVICQEVGGLDDYTKKLVGNVVLNRVASSNFPDTVYDVITQYMQYGMMWKYGVHFPDWATSDDINACYDVARWLLSGERICPENVVYQAEFLQGSGIYYADYENDLYLCYE